LKCSEAQRINGVCAIDRDRQHYGRAMTFYSEDRWFRHQKKKKHTYLVIRNMFVRFIFIFQLSILQTIISALIRRTITIQSQLVLQFTRLNLETPAQLLAVLSFKRNC
jgi:hypothetical protein